MSEVTEVTSRIDSIDELNIFGFKSLQKERLVSKDKKFE